MKWLVVVLFATPGQDLYIFTDPTFETKQECETSIRDPEQVPKYIKKLSQEYLHLPPIRAVGCIEEQEMKKIMEGKGA